MPITKTINFLPGIFQSDTNRKFLNATLDQLMTEPNLIPINGYVGRKFAPGFNSINSYVLEPTADRADYQLEPSIVVKNQNTNNVEFQTTYPEILQKLDFYGGNTDNQDTLWSSDFYSYNSRINADAFINFGQYYWLPNGPTPVDVYAGTADLERTFYVYPDAGLNVYNLSGFGTVPNPDLVFARGGNYKFIVNQPGKSFYIQTQPGISGISNRTNQSTRQILGVTNNGTDVGTISFNVPSATDQDFYTSMPVVQEVDLVSTVSYADLQGKLLSEIKSQYGGIDGQNANLNGKYLIFENYSANAADWTASSVTVPESQRYGIWKIILNPVGLDYIFTLVYYLPIPENNKVIIMSGLEYGNTEWYTTSQDRLQIIPVITAPLTELYYQDSSDPSQYGVIKIVEASNNIINVDSEILGKKGYVSPNGVTFTNGLKIVFDDSVTPEAYQNKEYYVDGVGSGIVLVAVSDLIINAAQAKNNYQPSQNFVVYASAKLNAAADQLTVTTTDNPDGTNVAVGQFPNTINSNYIVEQNIEFRYPYRAGQNLPGEHENLLFSADNIGVTLPGIVINGVSNGATVPGQNNTTWHYDINQVLINGQDAYGGYTLDNGRYVYTNSNFITANAWGNVTSFVQGYTDLTTGHSKLIGFAKDGYPIYGPFGYDNPIDDASGIIRMVSSYTASSDGLYRPPAQTVTVTADATSTNFIAVSTTNGINPGMRVTLNNGGISEGTVWVVNNGLKTAQGLPNFNGTISQIQLNTNVTVLAGTSLTFEFLPGAFIEDYTFDENTGTLDQYNGRFCVTPEFPNGTYAYFVTQNSNNQPVYPYIVGSAFYGSTAIDTNTSLATPDYLIISRASKDLNPWTRRNRWFHKNVLELTTIYTNIEQIVDSENRAKRPIIEFDSDLQLYNFGKTAKQPVDIFDTRIETPFTTVEGVTGIFVDGIELVEGMRIIFGADQDPNSKAKIWVVTFVNIYDDPTQPEIIHLVPATDSTVLADETVSVFNGITNNGKSFWYTGTEWLESQQKLTVNQAPLFDVFDNEGISFNDISKYPIVNNQTRFQGNKIFGYKLGEGSADPVLGFPLSYKNFNNVGDIEFENFFETDTFSFGENNTTVIKNVNSGFLHKNNANGTFSKINTWTNVNTPSRQMQDLAFTYDGITNRFNIDIIPDLSTTEPNIIVYVNAKRLPVSDINAYPLPDNNLMLVINPLKIEQGDRIDILVYNSTESSQIGFYTFPDNLNYNPQNALLKYPTLGELRNHIGELSQNNLLFTGSYPGVSNLRDLYIENFAGTMLQQSAPISYAGMFLSDEEFNFVSSLLNAQQEYTKFKNKFLTLAGKSNQIDPTNPVTGVDYILKQINIIKDKTFPWYYSDMVPYGDNKKTITYSVFNPNQRNYEITEIFSNETVGSKAILLYLNSTQLIYGIDYTFLVTGPGVRILDTVELNIDDTITIVEYYDTDGNWIPETPTKLGLYPKFTPEIFTDYTYTTPQTFIKGHDGSLTVTFGDFRDQLILELEKRIYNNIKVVYSEKLVNIYDSIPGKFRDTGFTLAQYNNLIARHYLQWTGVNNLDYVTNSTYVNDSPFSYNYSSAKDKINDANLPGSWRACYEYFYDCQTPHLSPWEMLGFSEQPDWWENEYGPSPYTSGNKILWTDLQNGLIAQGSRQGIDNRFKRPGLLDFIPVNENGELLPPIGLITTSYDSTGFNRSWVMGQFSPTETAWRNSSDYPFAVQYAIAMMKPAKYFAYGLNTNKYRYNTDLDQYVITGTNYRIVPDDVDVNGYTNSNGSISRASGYLNWITDYQTSKGVTDKQPLLDFVRNYNIQLSYRMAGFSGKQYLKILAEQNSPESTNETIIIPDSDYDLVLSKSTPVLNVRYSGVIIEKTNSGFKVSGYDLARPYFTVVPPVTTGTKKIVRVLDRTVEYYTEYTNYRINVPYGTEFTNLQQLSNLLSGIERFLTLQGFKFGYFDERLGQIRNWELSVRELLFWVQQGWGVGSVITLSPVADTLKLTNTSATVDVISNSFFGTKVVNQNFSVLNSDGYSVTRDNNQFDLALTNSVDLIGYAELNLVQYEHVLIFNNKTQFNDIIYDSVMGQRQYRLKIVGQKTGGWTGTLAAQGFIYNQPGVQAWRMNKDYLKGDLVEYKNFYYAANKKLPGATSFNFSDWLPVDKNKIKTGLLSNFARNAQLPETFYDVDQVNLESQYDQFALGLIGYRNRSYLNELGLDDASQVKFYQGYIKEKGTRNSINALGQVSFSGRPSDVSVSEDWAFRVGGYGSVGTNQFVELVLDEAYTLNNPTSVEVLSNNSVVFGSLYNDNLGLYKTAVSPWSSPFLLNRTINSDYSDDILTAGFVNIEDVDFTLFDLRNITSLNAGIQNIGDGSSIWVAKDYNQKWNVFRVVDTDTKIVNSINALNNRVSIVTDKFHNLSKNDPILITNTDKFNGFYRVITVESLTSFTIEVEVSLRGFSSATQSGSLFKLISMRVTDPSDIISIPSVTNWMPNDKVWVDNSNTQQEWAVYNKTEPWSMTRSLPSGTLSNSRQYGSSVSLSNNNKFAVVGIPGYSGSLLANAGAISNYILNFNNELVEDVTLDGKAVGTIGLGSVIDSGTDRVIASAPLSGSGRGWIYTYKRGAFGSLTESQLLCPNVNSAANFGYSISVSKDDQWLYVGAPEAGTVFVYALNNLMESGNSSVTANGNVNSFVLSFTPYDSEAVLVRSASRTYVPNYDYTISGSTINFVSPPPAGTISVVQEVGYSLYATIAGNAAEKFGYSVSSTIEGAQVVIGSPQANVTVGNVTYTNSGSVDIWNRSIENYIAKGSENLFSGISAISEFTKVYLDGTLQTLGIDWVPFNVNWVLFSSTPKLGQIVTVESNILHEIQSIYPQTPYTDQQFGYSVDICTNNCSLFVGAPYQSQTNLLSGAVYRFLNQGRVYGTITGTIQNPTVNSGDSLRINNFVVTFNNTNLGDVVTAINNANIPGVTASAVNGYLKIDSNSLVLADKLRILPGIGSAINDLGLEVFTEVELINNYSNKSYDYFGKVVQINNNSNILVVASDSAATLVTTTFDLTSRVTTFDTGSTGFKEPVDDSGSVWIYSYLPSNVNSIANAGKFAFIQQLTPTSAEGSLKTNDRFGSGVSITEYQMLIGSLNFNQFNFNAGKVFQFNNQNNLLGWDKLRSQEPRVDINGITKAYIYDAQSQSIQYNLDYIDPAKGKILGLAEQEITYKIDYDPAVYNNTSLSTVAKDNNLFWTNQQVGQVWWDLSVIRYIDYEQGSIKYRNSNWGRAFPNSSVDVYEWVESIYPPSQYVANGGSGTPKYPSDNAYTSLTYIDPLTNYATVKYYFWVKDKTTLSVNQFGRSIPVATIASFIRDPKNTGIKYFAALKDDSVAIYNMENETTGRNTIFHLDYVTQINSNIIHNEFALLNDTTSKSDEIPQNIYNKMVDSISGADVFGNPVPDPTLQVQNRYGIDFRPRQSMVIDKDEAMREFVLYTNKILEKNLISQGYDISGLSLGEPIPTSNSGAYDLTVTNLEELSYVNIQIRPIGYKVLVQTNSLIGNLWTIYVKDRSVLTWQPNTNYKRGQYILNNQIAYYVKNNFTSGATFTFTDDIEIYNVRNEWVLDRVQAYNNNDYWEFVDWYAPNYDQTVKPNYTIQTTAELGNLNLKAQDIVKILNNGQGKWFIIQVFPNIVNTVAIQDGTIQLKDNLYELPAYGMGFDSDNFDINRFDQNPSIEIRSIVDIIKNNIFINNLDIEFLKLFFVFVNYVLYEQKNVDWVFKTSFINVLQQIKGLNQPPIYSRENIDIYLDYINEVKPYKTTVREYVVDYQGDDNYTGYVTDFDVPPYYDPVLKINRSPSGEFIEDIRALQQPQYADWLSNYSYNIESIEIINGGTGYTFPPTVVITGSNNGNDAVARALITNGVVTKIILVYAGSDYITTPIISIVGGNGTKASARAVLKNDKVRSITAKLVYDRYTYGSTIVNWTPNTVFTQGQIITYNSVAYVVNTSFTSGNNFSLTNLTVYPVTKIDNANDRIQAYYNPEIGLPGKDFALLQSGIDYPGVKVKGPDFDESGGFDVAAFDSTPFDPLTIDSDGTYVISDVILDTVITSDYTDTTLGTKPEDIIVDGGPYVYDKYTEWRQNTFYDKGDLVSYNNQIWYTVQPFTSSTSFSANNFTTYNIGPYASHAPEELVPGRVYDTLDLRVSTLAVDPLSTSYQNWSYFQGIYVDSIAVANGGSGYNPGTTGVVLEGGGYITQAVAQVLLDANGTAYGFQILNGGAGYHTTPNVIITGSNTTPIIASAVMKISNAPSSANPYAKLSYRVFKDMVDNYTYIRIDGSAITTLAANLEITDTEINVTNASVLPEPAGSGGEPGVVFINGERITYYTKDSANNRLGQLRRGTNGTGIKKHLLGDSVVDGGQSQYVPYSSNRIWYAGNTGPGSINISVNSTTINGTNTYFLSNLTIGGNIFAADGRYIGVVSSISSNTLATVSTTPRFNATGVSYDYAADVTLTTGANVAYTFYSNTGYIRSNLWYSSGGTPISTEFANVITTESSRPMDIDGTGQDDTATDGTGLYNATTIQSQFLRQGQVG
jgi:hypothetical protein